MLIVYTTKVLRRVSVLGWWFTFRVIEGGIWFSPFKACPATPQEDNQAPRKHDVGPYGAGKRHGGEPLA